MGKARQIGIVDGDALDLLRQMTQTGPEDQTQTRGLGPGPVADQGGQGFSVP